MKIMPALWNIKLRSATSADYTNIPLTRLQLKTGYVIKIIILIAIAAQRGFLQHMARHLS
jgi:hypothetical protein